MAFSLDAQTQIINMEHRSLQKINTVNTYKHRLKAYKEYCEKVIYPRETASFNAVIQNLPTLSDRRPVPGLHSKPDLMGHIYIVTEPKVFEFLFYVAYRQKRPKGKASTSVMRKETFDLPEFERIMGQRGLLQAEEEAQLAFQNEQSDGRIASSNPVNEGDSELISSHWEDDPSDININMNFNENDAFEDALIEDDALIENANIEDGQIEDPFNLLGLSVVAQTFSALKELRDRQIEQRLMHSIEDLKSPRV